MAIIKAATGPPRYHFFGYYGMSPWNGRESRLLCLEVEIQNHPPRPGDLARVGYVDLSSMEFVPFARTRTWNFQQGCMMHWLPVPGRDRVIHNDLVGEGHGSIIVDLDSGERRALTRPVSAVSRGGRYALSLNFSRLHDKRPGYGYAGLADPWADDPHPREDGVHVIDLETGESWLAVSLEEVYDSRSGATDLEGVGLWFNHTLFNPDGSRFVFLCRFTRAGLRRTAMYTSDIEGSDTRCLVEYGLVSHFDWLDSDRILAWANIRGNGDAFYLIDDRDGSFRKIGEGVLTQDGHCSFSPDKRWILTDQYPGPDHTRPLMIYEWKGGDLRVLSRLYSLPELTGEIRCDLHPRWNCSGERICFDSTHEGSRQIYVMELDEEDLG
jgi:hypothetical protein